MRRRGIGFGGIMMRSKPDLGSYGTPLDEQGRATIADSLGVAPREALSALVGYGLHDHDIARYHGIPCELVTELRELWRIPPPP